MNFELQSVGDNAIMVSFGSQIDKSIHKQVSKLSTYLSANPFDWMTAYIPAYTSVTIFYDPIILLRDAKTAHPYDIVDRQISAALENLQEISADPANIIEIPVCYGGKHGPDLSYVAEMNHLSEKEVIAIHSKTTYLVYMIGFVPGFPYAGRIPKEIRTPRKATPRKRIPAGSVGIADEQTGIYPISSPGGWQIIGRTPLELFRPDAAQPSLLKAGDHIRFKPVDEKVFQDWREMDAPHR